MTDVDSRRMLALARVWGEAKYFHPGLASPTIRWDSLGAAAIDVVDHASSQTAPDFANAVSSMLRALNDPVTRVIAPRAESDRLGASARRRSMPGVHWSADSILVLTVGTSYEGPTADSARRVLAGLRETAARARRVVVDLRGTEAASSSDLTNLLAATRVDRALLARAVCGPGSRHRHYTGLPGGFDVTAPGWREVAPRCFAAGSSTPKSGVVFLVDSASAIPVLAPAMQAAGLGAIVSVGVLTDQALVTLDTIPLAPGIAVQMRRAELTGCRRSSSLADTVVMPSPTDESDGPLAAAGAIIARMPMDARCAPSANADAASSSTAPNAAVPPRPWRILAAFEIYNAIRFFDPHTGLIAGRNWDSVFTAVIPTMADAGTRPTYLAAVSRFSAALNDGHAVLPPNRLLELFGSAYPPLNVRRIEGELVIEDNFDSAATPGVRRGDIVFSVDGLDAATRYADVRQYVSGSTPASRDARTSIFWLGGPDSSTATLVVGDLRGRRDTVRVPRRQRYLSLAFNPAPGQPLRLLAGTVGYVDLSRLPVSGVDSMFERFASTRALILDVRGYPQGTHGVIGARLAKTGAIAARILSPVVDGPDRGPELITPGAASSARSFTETSQYIVPDGRAPYAGRVYVLVDERSISQSEQAALFYRAAARATLVGSNTAGADGNYTMFSLPGGEGFVFTGSAVLAPDGTPIQGVGLTPDVRVTPTIAGLRAGRDEVLDCAVRLATGASRTCGSGRPSDSVP
jgi:hypothetical protein